MKNKDYFSEFELIDLIRKKAKISKSSAVRGIGDDAAVINYDKKNYMLFTTDSLVENVHFSLNYFSPKQVGMKAVEQNVSDIAAMGGIPKFALVSLGLKKSTNKKFVESLYDGILKAASKYKIEAIGGNITSSKDNFITIFLAGFVEKKKICLRSAAKKGDLVFCTGNVGKSAAGLELLKSKKTGESVKSHIEPKSRLALSQKLVRIGINSMIDVSDGVAPEISHICQESKVGAVIYADKLPISESTIEDAKKSRKNPVDFALYGGEDFELIFTADKSRLSKLKNLDVSVIGEIIDKKYGVKVVKGGKEIKIKKGFDHFAAGN
ncbi:MAG TPA: thiamine-phosphate kinase [Candidatus Nanoarchaeia archaeon]|nr:thiamine-phosphate kinase [Candidatus Nanoarchaeia archaeon]